MKQILTGLALVAASVAAAPVLAQAFPNKPLHIVIAEPPGSGGDTFARLIGGVITKTSGQPVIIDFKPGSNFTIAAKAVVTAPADGYTTYFGVVQLFHPLFNKANGVSAGQEMAPVSSFFTGTFGIFSRSKLPVTSFQELIAYSKANPGKLNFGAPATVNEVAMKLVQDRTGITYGVIPYKNNVDVVNAMLGDQIDFTLTSVPPLLPHIQSGAMRALMVTSTTRAPALPNTPSTSEAGVRDFNLIFYYGMWAPLNTPRDVIQRLNSYMVASVKDPEISSKIRQFSFNPTSSTPEELLKMFNADIAFWTEATKLAKFEPQ